MIVRSELELHEMDLYFIKQQIRMIKKNYKRNGHTCKEHYVVFGLNG